MGVAHSSTAVIARVAVMGGEPRRRATPPRSSSGEDAETKGNSGLVTRRDVLAAGAVLGATTLVGGTGCSNDEPSQGTSAPNTSSKIGADPTPTSVSASDSPTVQVTEAPRQDPPRLDGAQPPPPPGYVFERVITKGKVIDPASGYETVADVGIDGGTVRSISSEPLTGKQTIDATGLVVAPGFIDFLSYEPNDFGSWYKLGDGVTTNLGMHGLKDQAAHFFTRYGNNDPVPPVNYGGAFENNYMRHEVNKFPSAPLTSAQLDRYLAQLEEHLHLGWLGVDCEPEYNPWVPTSELEKMGEVAAKLGLPFFWHARYSSPDDRGADGSPHDNAAALDEVLQVARKTGAAVHIEHINSTGGTHTMAKSIETLENARADGIDVTACVYPYDFWATTASSARFSPGWERRFRITYSDLAIPGRPGRLDARSFANAQAQNLLVAAYAIPEEDIVTALKTPWIMLGSDAILVQRAGGRPNNHPRAAGTFTRVLGRYVRELEVLGLKEALAKMTILPAKRLDKKSPAMRRKGRLQIGADADITVFDPATVADRATIDAPDQMAIGVKWVLVAGQVVLNPDGPVKTARPGKGVKSEV